MALLSQILLINNEFNRRERLKTAEMPNHDNNNNCLAPLAN